MKYKKIRIILFVFILPFVSIGTLYAQKSSDTARTKIGTPKEGAGGWPTTGTITQGPRGGSHGTSNLVALDIANGAGTPIYATFDGLARAFDCTNRGECDNSRGRLGNYVMIVPSSNPSAEILYGHMLSVAISDGIQVKKGELIGFIGNTGYSFGNHLHYEFRRIPMTTPNIPTNIVPDTCVSSCSPQSISSGE